MSHTYPSPGPPSDGLSPGIMASLRRRSEHLANLDVDQEQSSEQASSDVGANGTGPSNPVRKLTGILSRSSTPSKERKDSRHSLDVPQISIRPSNDQSLAQRIINNRPDTPPDSNPRPSTDTSGRLPIDAARKRGVAFLSRLGVRSGRKKDDGGDDDDDDDGASHISEYRSEGAGAAMMPASNAAGFIPHHKEPPKYVRVRPYNTKNVEFGHLFLAQELSRSKPMASTAPITTAGKRVVHSGDSIWAVEFSKDGRFLAAAGQDMVVRVYAMLTTPDERRTYEDEMQGSPDGERLLRAPVFRTKPLREYQGHTGSIHDLAWSKNNFLLSASSDKTVRLWYPFLPNCLHVFEHKDSVMSISFHPTDDRFFLAGAQDNVLRLWSIPDKEVAFQIQETDIITAVAFAPDGKTCMAGLMSGDCIFYETKGLARQSQVQVRSSRGKNSKGSKITSIQAMAIPPNTPGAEVKVLISSNDSRIRIYNLSDKSLGAKLRGHENSCSNVKARFNDDGAYIITGSEDRRTFIWPTDPPGESKDKRPYESFVAHSGAVTAAVIAPKVSRLLLSASGDPVYDLCNPPPVTLMSMAEATASHSVLSDEPPDTPNRARRMEESPAYLARSAHPDGNIIVTADRTGQIRVFRQDCANTKRRSDPWELGSASRLVLSSRAASIATRNSAGSRVPSRRNSLVGTRPPSITLTPQHSTERINTWRQNVVEHGGRMRPVSLPPSVISASIRSDRSASPSKVDVSREPAASVSTLASDARRQPYAGISSPLTSRFPPGSPTSSINTDRTSTERANALKVATLALAGSTATGSAVSTPVVGLGLGEPISTPRISLSSRSMEPNEETGADEAVPDVDPVATDSDDKSGGTGTGNGSATGNPPGSGSGNGGLFSFWNGLPKWRNISGLRILTSASSPAIGGLSPKGSADASPTKSDPNSPAIGTGRVSISTLLVRINSNTSSEPNEEPASQRR
jgi:WD40 repeat protein